MSKIATRISLTKEFSNVFLEMRYYIRIDGMVIDSFTDREKAVEEYKKQKEFILQKRKPNELIQEEEV